MQSKIHFQLLTNRLCIYISAFIVCRTVLKFQDFIVFSLFYIVFEFTHNSYGNYTKIRTGWPQIWMSTNWRMDNAVDLINTNHIQISQYSATQYCCYTKSIQWVSEIMSHVYHWPHRYSSSAYQRFWIRYCIYMPYSIPSRWWMMGHCHGKTMM